MEDAVQVWGDSAELDVITAGEVPPNPSELLASERMKTLLTNFLHGPFDWIVIDTPPVLAVTDAVLLSPLASGVAFVIRSEMTPSRHVRRAIRSSPNRRSRRAAPKNRSTRSAPIAGWVANLPIT